MIFNQTLPAGGSSSDRLLVTFTSDGDTYTADKAFGEIAAALDAGINPVVKFDTNRGVFVSIVELSIANSGDCYMKLSQFISQTLSGGQSDYPSYTSGN